MGFRVKLHGSNFELLMSALGHKRTLRHVRAMSALPPKADMVTLYSITSLARARVRLDGQRIFLVVTRMVILLTPSSIMTSSRNQRFLARESM
jgi:hypothetical protein